MADFNKVKLTGLWKHTSKAGETYLSGSLGAARVVVFTNGHKNKDTDPDYIAYLVPVEKKTDKKGAEAARGGFDL